MITIRVNKPLLYAVALERGFGNLARRVWASMTQEEQYAWSTGNLWNHGIDGQPDV
jgi:hypothetical protein